MATVSQLVQLNLASSAYANGGVQASPVPTSANASTSLVDQAVQLAADASTVVTLTGGSISPDAASYNAAGLLDSFTQAGNLQGGLLSASAGQATDTAANSTDSGVIAADASTATAASSSDGSTSSSDASLLSQLLDNSVSGTQLNSQWSRVLQGNPALAGEAVQNMSNGSIVNTLA
ncbi:hypothetical protein [Vogesella sp. LIG4]|uniref:hypothetical protein n=1 Tax=Vogesella sp. LIG4 TaxID=1192162 RepID=UPI00081FA259|nr:hypothetical protein [Vogesella sp. LIG4]SCK16377.1 hypothetical protein PSELUDRAFT_1662 [Vogesella sp. LIG4]